jgi:hypothetical protein
MKSSSRGEKKRLSPIQEVSYDSSIGSYKFSRIESALLSKLKKVREKIEKDNDIYINKEHEELCYYYNKYQELLKKNKITNKEVFFDSIDDGITMTNQISKLESGTINFVKYYIKDIISYNEYNHKFINKIQKFINIDVINDFIKEQSAFIKSLNIREIYNLKNYTHKGDVLIVNYITGKFTKNSLNINYNVETLLYFQFLDYFKENPEFNGSIVDTSNPKKFLNFLHGSYLLFPNEIFNEVISNYIRELLEIFEKAPKTKEVMYVYRGVKDNYISKEVSKNKTRGIFTSNRFTSVSLFAETAIKSFTNMNNILYEIKIEKGMPVIFIDSISLHKGEYEVLIPINASFYIDYALKKVKYYKDKTGILCNDKVGSLSREFNITSLVHFK